MKTNSILRFALVGFLFLPVISMGENFSDVRNNGIQKITHNFRKVNIYTPGLGEIMTATQMRHSKLWFAGKASNWKLAEYELFELQEGFDDAIKFHPDRTKFLFETIENSIK